MEIVNVFSCGECGFDNSTMSNEELTASIAAQARKYRAPLTRALLNEDLDAILRRRPSPEVWSALEYAVHQREVIGFYGGRIEAVATQDNPQLRANGFGEAAERDRYNDADPPTVADEITAAATAVAQRLASLAPGDWQRTGKASTAGDPPRDIRNLASRLAHEGHHHLLDIGRSLRAARS